MKTNPLLEELWQVKDDLAREAGYDLDRIFAELRAAEARQPGPLIRTADELRRYVADAEHRQKATPVLAMKEEPPPPDFRLWTLGATPARLLSTINPQPSTSSPRAPAAPRL